MPVPTHASAPLILHVAGGTPSAALVATRTCSPSSTPPSDTCSMAEALAATGCRVGEYPDVYRTLAGLAQHTPPPVAIVLCIDPLGDAEFEFFRLCMRIAPQSPVYVYGGSASRGKLQRAIVAGARGRIDAGVLTKLTQAADAAGSARVPWQAHNDRPRRRPPPEAPQSSIARGSDNPSSTRPVRVDSGDDVDDGVLTGAVHAAQASPAEGMPRTIRDRRETSRNGDPVEPEGDAIVSYAEAEHIREPLISEAELRALLGEDAEETGVTRRRAGHRRKAGS